MKELNYEEYEILESLFNQKKQHIPALSVLRGSYPGRVFTDATERPTLAIVWATGRWMYAAGDINPEQNKEAVKLFLQDVVLPDCKAQNRSWFEIYTDDSREWETLFLGGMDKLNKWNVDKHLESVYVFHPEQFNRRQQYAKPDITSNLRIELSEYPILPDAYHHLPYVHTKFAEQRTCGAAVKLGERTLSICKNNGFTAGREYFIDVDTFEAAERNKGYAEQAATALIDYYLTRGMIPLWETTHDNHPSHRLACKLGFAPVEQYPVFSFVRE